jgi:hypothetical protein
MSPDAPHVRRGLHDEAARGASPSARSSTPVRRRRSIVARVARVMARRDAAANDPGAGRVKREDVDLAGRS